MRILVSTPGHIRTAPMGRYCAETFKSMGHEVRLFDAGSLTLREKVLFRPLAKLRGKNRIEKTMLNRRLWMAADQFKPDFFLSIFGFDIFPETIDQIQKKGAVTACWWLNDPFQFERGLFHAPVYNFFFSNCEASTRRYHDHGLASAYYLPHAAFTPIHHPLSNGSHHSKKYETEVCFVGDWGPVRQGILSALSQRIDLKIWGPWKKHLRPKDRLWSRIHDGYFSPEQMVRIFSTAKIAINLHSWFGYYTTGFNPRTFETPACKTLQICDWKEGLDHHFAIDKEIVTYQSGQEMESKIKNLLANLPTLENIAEQGFQRTVSQHTYLHRMKTMLQTCGLEK